MKHLFSLTTLLVNPGFRIDNFHVKGSIFLKNRHFIIKDRLNKLIYGIDIIVSLSFLNGIFFFVVFFYNRISEFMLPALILRYHKKSFHF